jgi:hypothetical protein
MPIKDDNVWKIMKSDYFYKNLYLFNLVETHEISSKTLIRVFRKYADREIDRLAVISSIGNTPTSRKIIEALEFLNRSFLSLHCLTIIGINSLIINKLKSRFKSIEDLSINQREMSGLRIQNSIKVRIIGFVEDFISNHDQTNIVYVKYHVFTELHNHMDALSSNDLFQLVIAKEGKTTIGQFYDAVNELSMEGKVKTTPKGISLRRVTIDEYISSNNGNKGFEVLSDRLNDVSSKDLLSKYKVSRQRIDQIIKSLLKQCPIFEDEDKYKKILSEYKLSQEAMELLDISNLQLARYIRLKYELRPEKNEVDYVLDTKRQFTVGGKQVLQNNKKLWLEGFLLDFSFRGLIEHFINVKSVYQFELKSFSENLRDYYHDHHVEFDFGMDNPRAYLTRVGNIPNILNCGGDIYYFLREEDLSNDFLYLTREYFDNFYGYGSALHFYLKHEEVCIDNNINNENVLFAILKHLYGDEYSNQVQFVRNPTFITKDLTKEDFFRDLIEEKSPIDKDLFFDYLYENYGLSKNSLYWNSVEWFDEYLDENNQLNIREKEDLSFFQDFIDNTFSGYPIISTEYYKQQLNELTDDYKKRLLNNNLLRKLGYRYSNKAVYRRTFSNTNEAYKELFNQLNKTVSYHELLRFFSRYNLDNPRYEEIFEECFLLKYSEESYLNINKMDLSILQMIEFREKLLSTLTASKVYLSTKMMNSRTVLDLFDQYSDVKKIVSSMGDMLFDSLLDSSRKVYSMITSKGYLFTIGERISHKLVLRNIIDEYEEFDRNELEYYVNEHYGIDLELSPGYISELGYYYSQETNMIYISKSRFESILLNYLNDGEKQWK